MPSASAVVSPLNDDALAEFQGHLNLVFARLRLVWKEAASRVHPDLQLAAYKLLMFIARNDGTSAHELVERFEMDKSVVSRQVRMLEDLGLLESRPDDADGRQRVLTATPQARAALAELRREHAARLRDALGDVTREEIHATTRVFQALSEI